VTDDANEAAGIAQLNAAAHAEWKAREAFRKELCACLSRELPKDPLQQHIQALRMAAEVVGRLGDIPDETITLRHPVADALDHLAQSLSDLPLGVVEVFLRPPKGVSSRLMTETQRRQARDAVTSTRALKNEKGKTAGEARSQVARELGVKKSQIRSWETPGRNPGLRK
jgi:hypothetical protein